MKTIAEALERVETLTEQLNAAGRDRQSAQTAYQAALITGQPIDRQRLRNADAIFEQRSAELSEAQAALTEVRHRVALARANSNVVALQKNITKVLSRHPLEAA